MKYRKWYLPCMKKIFYLIFLLLLGCGQQKPSEQVAVELPQDDTLKTIVSKLVQEEPTVTTEPEPVFKTISVEDNKVLEEVAKYPFAEELDAMKATLDSLGVESVYENGENGSLSYDSAEISFNRSYGESICEANIQSPRLALNKGITLGMTLADFLSLTGMKSPSQGTLCYEYTYSAQEHAYTIRFDFLNEVLTSFYYHKDPCVIYD